MVTTDFLIDFTKAVISNAKKYTDDHQGQQQSQQQK